MKPLSTTSPELRLVAPDPSRDAPFAVGWFSNEDGTKTLQLMGNAAKDITPTSYEKEYAILTGFNNLAASGDQLTWMLRTDNETIGATWVELKDTAYLSAPAISIMIGNPSNRRRGYGTAAMNAVIDYLKDNYDFDDIYARRLVGNSVSARLLDSLDFKATGEPYTDADGLRFQSFKKSLRV